LSQHDDIQQEKELGKVYDSRLMRRLLAYLRPYWRSVLGGLIPILLSAGLQLVPPLAVAAAIDLFIAPGARDSGSPFIEWLKGVVPVGTSPEDGIFWVAILYLIAVLLTFVVLCVQGYILQIMGQKIMLDLRQEIFQHMQRLPVAFFDRNPIGRLVTRVTTDVAALNEMFTSGVVTIVGDLMLLSGIVLVLFWLNWRLALVSFAIIPLLFLLTFWFKTRARRQLRIVRVKIAAINAYLQEHIVGMPVVQLFNQEARVRGQFGDINEDYRGATVRAIFYYAVYFPMIELITAIGIGLLIWYGGGEVLSGALSLGALIAFLQYAQRFYQPLADLSDKYNILQGAMASSERIFQLLDTPVEITSPDKPQLPAEVRGGIELEDVVFSYKAGEPVLKGVSFAVNPGETLAVVGHTGAGKSTLANLLLRFYDVDSGTVRLDGVDVRQWPLDALRTNVGLVLQDVFLFSGSIGGNIRLGSPDIDEERMRWAAREVNAEGFIERLPKGYATVVKERGAGLSVGQKQLIAFARALAFDPKILILDEATSSVDTETEQLIQQALDRLLENRTSIVIAHRLSTIQKADRILVMHKGEVREQGTHQELLALGGIYHKLYQLQYQEEHAAVEV
jgi:ATP-binding cassette, subfamily B, multidrug efflux pump